MAGAFRLGVDIGGTFTDGVLLDELSGRVWVSKTLTTERHEDAALATVGDLCRQASIALNHVESLAHATTLASNTVILRRGAKVGLVTTDGFEDIVEIAREGRYDTYNLWLDPVEPLVERINCVGLRGRILADGTEYVALSTAAIDETGRQLRERKVEAVAVCLLNSYVNDEHELAVRSRLGERGDSSIPVSLSSEVSPEMREYERACTTLLNSYLQPSMGKYQHRLEAGLTERGYPRSMYVMLSSGGLATTEIASRFPVRMLESGPVAGVFAAADVAARRGSEDAIALDVGGTTAKIALIRRGAPGRVGVQEVCRSDRFAKGSGLPVQLPSIDLLEIGAGGGSIARVGPLGFLQVGPESAEARPGPACYGLGGNKPTVTDAAVVLGYIDPQTFAGGAVAIDEAAARRALGELGAEVGLSADECAAHVIDVLNENMAQATRVHLAERGQDATRVHLIASGGGGPLHGAEIARRVGIPEMIIPRRPGVLSALGLVLTPPSIELAQSRMVRFDDKTDWAALNDLLRDLDRRAREMLAGTGVDVGRALAEWSSELRWIGQTHAFRVALTPPPYGPEFCATVVRLFTAEALRLHGLSLQETVLEALTWRVVVTVPRASVAVEPSAATSGQRSGPTGRRVYSRGQGMIEVPVYDRSKMEPGWQGLGPALISDESSTCLIGAGDRFQVDNERGDVRVVIARRGRGSAVAPEAVG